VDLLVAISPNVIQVIAKLCRKTTSPFVITFGEEGYAVADIYHEWNMGVSLVKMQRDRKSAEIYEVISARVNEVVDPSGHYVRIKGFPDTHFKWIKNIYDTFDEAI